MDYSKENQQYGVTIGTFDGVHAGHRLVLDTLRRECEAAGLKPVAITFRPHPMTVICPQRAPLLLETEEQRLVAIREAGVTPEIVDFTPEIQHTKAAEWIRHLADDYNAKLLVTGYDNGFGSDCRQLTADDYKRFGEQVGLRVIRAPELPGVSSTAVRKAIAAGDVEQAARLLGHPYRLTGKVVAGKQLGRQLGFPTANLQTHPGLQLPAPGVYAAYASSPVFDGKTYKAVVNIGNNPTVSESNPVTVEAYILGYVGNLYDRELTLSFAAHIRNEQHFDSLETLRVSIARDVATADKLLS